MNAIIQKSLDEKTILLREIHHRVKNNLQVVSSLLSMQSKHTNEKEVKELLKSNQNRVKSMALIHEKLYQVDDLSLIDYNNYVSELVQKLIKTYNKEGYEIDFKFHSEPFDITIETAIPLGLLLNEIISNSLKHAFKEQPHAEIHLTITHLNNNTYSLNIGDNGIGFKENINYKDSNSLGVMLVQKMTKQLNGTIEKCTLNKGTHYNITFQNN